MYKPTGEVHDVENMKRNFSTFVRVSDEKVKFYETLLEWSDLFFPLFPRNNALEQVENTLSVYFTVRV